MNENRHMVPIKIVWDYSAKRTINDCLSHRITRWITEIDDEHWSLVVEFGKDTRASFLFDESAPKHLLIPGFEFGLWEAGAKVGAATVLEGIDVMRTEYINRLLILPLASQRTEIQQFILDMMDMHEQTDEETLYIDLLGAFDGWNNK